jgi:hypothetical protein
VKLINESVERVTRKCYCCDVEFTPRKTEGICSDCGRTIIRPFINKARKVRGHYPKKIHSRGR